MVQTRAVEASGWWLWTVVVGSNGFSCTRPRMRLLCRAHSPTPRPRSVQRAALHCNLDDTMGLLGQGRRRAGHESVGAPAKPFKP
jgi:hypothetical protein